MILRALFDVDLLALRAGLGALLDARVQQRPESFEKLQPRDVEMPARLRGGPSRRNNSLRAGPAAWQRRGPHVCF